MTNSRCAHLGLRTAASVYSPPADGYRLHAGRGNQHPVGKQTSIKGNSMGDKSPKANQKKSTQKQSKASSADASKKAAAAAKTVAAKKK